MFVHTDNISISVHVPTLLELYQQGQIQQGALLMILPVPLWNKVLELKGSELISVEGLVQ